MAKQSRGRQGIEPWPKFKKFDQCSPGELARLQLTDDNTEADWALIGKARERRFCQIFVLPRANSSLPRCLDAQENKIQPTILSYGTNYCFAPDYNGPCNLFRGPLFNAVGSFILWKSERFIWGWLSQDGSSGKAYYNIDNGELDLSGGPIGASAAFERWSLWLDPPKGTVPPIRAVVGDEAICFRVVEFTAKTTSKPPDLSDYEQIA